MSKEPLYYTCFKIFQMHPMGKEISKIQFALGPAIFLLMMCNVYFVTKTKFLEL